MSAAIFVTVALAFVLPSIFSGDDRMVSAQLEATKGQYLQGEPIELKLTLTNAGRDEIDLFADYPMFRTMDRSGITFALEGAALKDRPLGPEESFREQFGGRVPLVLIPPGGTWSVHVVLQRFVLSPIPGRYRLRYTADIPYKVKTGGETEHTSGQGELLFTVVSATPDGLKAALRKYAAQLDSPDYWGRRAAIEALTIVEDPTVVPHLVLKQARSEK